MLPISSYSEDEPRLFFRFRYRRKPNLYGNKAQFGIYLAQGEDGIIRVGDRVRVLREDKNF